MNSWISQSIKCYALLALMLCLGSWRIDKNAYTFKVSTQVPVLSYHNVQENPKNPSDYFISSAAFEKQIKHLKSKGYESVLPDDIYHHSKNGGCLPDKPIMFSFDDTRKEHYHIVAPILEKYRYKGTFFIMTIAIGKKNYMTSEELNHYGLEVHRFGLRMKFAFRLQTDLKLQL